VVAISWRWDDGGRGGLKEFFWKYSFQILTPH
jgi:hypothetical protein